MADPMTFDSALEAIRAVHKLSTWSDMGIEAIQVVVAWASCSAHGDFSEELVIDGVATWAGGIRCHPCTGEGIKRICPVQAVEPR